jgi:hypothetical protein
VRDTQQKQHQQEQQATVLRRHVVVRARFDQRERGLMWNSMLLLVRAAAGQPAQ